MNYVLKSFLNNKKRVVYLVDIVLYSIWHDLWFQLLNYSISLIILTTHEKQANNKNLANIPKFILSICLTIILAPIGLSFLLIWVILIRIVFRVRPYRLSIKSNDDNKKEYFEHNKTFQILSTNVCLLPEFAARFNNLHETNRRLIKISKILTDGVRNADQSTHMTENKSFIEIIDDFSKHSENVDFICFQEIWTIRHGKTLKDLLHHKFPYIIYDIGINALKSNFLIGLDSGLMFCSKYPILSIEFKTFSQKMKACRFSSKGLLMAKVTYMVSFRRDYFIFLPPRCRLV